MTNSSREFVCGWGAASINIITTFPVNKLIFRQQLLGIGGRDALQQLRCEGLRFLYRGVLPPLLMKSTSLTIMFGMYDEFGRILGKNCHWAPERMRKGTAGVLAGCVEAILTPFERVQTLLQDSKYHKVFRNMPHAMHAIGYKYGAREYFRGLTPILIRNGPSNAAFFLTRDEIKRRLPPAESNVAEFRNNFVYGGLLGASISTVFYPINVVKTHMQRPVGSKFMSFSYACKVVYHERNCSFTAMFRGNSLNCVRSLLSWGIMNASYELLRTLLYDHQPAY